MEYFLQNKKGMTLVEILVVMAIISILFASFFYIWNTIDIFRKSRDSKRSNDLQLLDTALKTILSTERNINLGEENIIYTSLPDSSSTCGSYNLVPLFSSYSYQCQTSENYLKVDGNGWLPINFTLGKILTIPVLPIDPLNNKDYFYAYQVRQGHYKLTAKFESQTNISKMANDGGFEPTLYEVGSDLFIPSPHSGLVGYWSFDEGTGTIAYDLSGYGNNGTLYNDPTWTTGKVGGALIFDGVDDYIDVIDTGTSSLDTTSAFTISVWIYPNQISTGRRYALVSKRKNTYPLSGYFLGLDNEGWCDDNPGDLKATIGFNYGNQSTVYIECVDKGSVSKDIWKHLVVTYNSSGDIRAIYENGIKQNSIGMRNVGTIDTNNESLFIGKGHYDGPFSGKIDEVRLYNRALSDAEIKAIYNATK